MARQEISRKRGKSLIGTPRKLRPGVIVEEHDPSIRLSDPKFVTKAILQAMENGDLEGVKEIYRAHLGVLNRSRGAKVMGVSRGYYHRLLHATTEPSLPTFIKFMHLLKEEQRGALRV